MLNICIPYRDRENNLKKVVPAIQNKLKLENVPYTIRIVEQDGTDLFNVAKLINVGFLLSYPFCEYRNETIPLPYIFHPVDCYPHKDGNPYALHGRGIVAMMSEDSQYPKGFIFNPHVFNYINGYSNDYWGWGGEDWEPERKSLTYGVKYDKIVYRLDRSEDWSGADDTTNIPNMQKCFGRKIQDWNSNGLSSTNFSLVDRKKYSSDVIYYKVKI